MKFIICIIFQEKKLVIIKGAGASFTACNEMIMEYLIIITAFNFVLGAYVIAGIGDPVYMRYCR